MTRCPACGQSLHELPSDAFPILVCHACGGALLPLRKLSKFIQSFHAVQIAEISEKTAKRGRRLCPTCRKWMLMATVPNRVCAYELDLCDHCDVAWFDAGELGQAPMTPEVVDLTEQAMRKFDAILGLRHQDEYGNVPFRIDRADFIPSAFFWVLILDTLFTGEKPAVPPARKAPKRPGRT